jgi:xanthine dehydrogenase accessory factor
MTLPPLVVVRGGGDTGTAAARRLFLAGLRVVVTERPDPWCVRRLTCFATAVAESTVRVDGVEAWLAAPDDLETWDWAEKIAVVICPDLPYPPEVEPDVLVDARVLKWGHDTEIDDAQIVVGVGPGFTVDEDCDVAVETLRGHDMGRVLYDGETRPFNGIPAPVEGHTDRRVLRTRKAGIFQSTVPIGTRVEAGDEVGTVDENPVLAQVEGILRGLIADGTEVRAQQKVGDVDPRGSRATYQTLSDKANAVGGGVVEAVLVLLQQG